MNNSLISKICRGFYVKITLLSLFLFTMTALSAQTERFSPDSIPMENGEIVFRVDYNFELDKGEYFRRSFIYLNSKMNPYSGTFLKHSNDSTVSRITDYLEISINPMHAFGMYMTYTMRIEYRENSCTLSIYDISFMEKEHFEAKEKSTRKLYNLPVYPAKEIMIKRSFKKLLLKNASGRATGAAIDRINEIATELDLSFLHKKL